MAKRGRPSNKTLQKRKEAKQKSELSILVAVLIVIAIIVVGYFAMTKGA